MACTGTVELSNGFPKITSENLYFTSGNSKYGRKNKQQDLTKVLLNYGEVKFRVEFVGDINRDGTPELILSEADNIKATFYYFMSDPNGYLKLQSMTWTYSKC